MLKVITGPMFSGKTKRIIQIVNNDSKDNKIVSVFKPKIDTCFNKKIVSRVGLETEAFEVNSIKDILKKIKSIETFRQINIDTIVIDEAQFIKVTIKDLIQLKMLQKDIYISGLNLTSELKPFKSMQIFLAFADSVEILTANCNYCANPASYTYYLGNKKKKVEIGNLMYEPLCLSCYKNRFLKKKLKRRKKI